MKPMTDDPKLLTQQLDHSLDNILNELESTSRALEKAENLIKTAGTWMDQHWGAKYDVLPSWAQKLIDESRKFAQHLQQWVDDHVAESRNMLTEEQVVDNLIRWMDVIGRVVMYLAFMLGFLVEIVQIWKWFH